MMRKHFACLGALTLAAGALVSAMGCSNQGDGGEDTGVAQVAISQVPFDGSVGCIAVTATGNHVVTQSVDVSPGQSTVLDMSGLPVGTVSFLGNAFQGPCAAVTAASTPTWVSNAVLASVDNVQPVMVHLVMHRNGQADVDVDFEEEPACRADGAPCFVGAECCSQSCVAGACSSAPPACGSGFASCNDVCVNLASDPFNCGACGAACPSGTCTNGACAQCQSPVDCPGADTECRLRTCVAGQCGLAVMPAGAVLSAQIPGDCRLNTCDGAGAVVSIPDDADVPSDGNECTNDACWGGLVTHMPAPLGSACTQSGGALCDGNGACVQCVWVMDCPGVDSECQTRTCTAGICGVAFSPAGTTVSSQIAGDCSRQVCNGAGFVTIIADDTDVPADDGNACTIDVCTGGVPAHPPAPAGTACLQSGGIICDGNGSCI